jgi:hypothetical protein
MFQDDEQIATFGSLSVETIALTPFTVSQMQRILTDFPDFIRLNMMLGNVFNAIVVPIQMANEHESP